MLSENSFPSLKKSIPTLNNDPIIPKPMMRYSDVLKQKKTTSSLNNSLKINNTKETKHDHKTDTLINSISEKTEKLSLTNSKSPISPVSSPKTKTPTSQKNNTATTNSIKIKKEKEEDIQKKYQKNIDSIVKIQAWWRMVSKIKSLKDIKKENHTIKDHNDVKDNKIEENKEKEIKKEEVKEQEIKKEDSATKNEEKKEPVQVKKLSKKPSFSDIVKSTPPPSPVSPEKPSSPKKSNKISKKNNNNNNSNNNNNNNNSRENKSNSKGNEKKNQNKKMNEELNSILKNMKFMGLIEKEIDDLTEKNTIVNGKQFAKTKVVTIKKFSRSNSASSNFSIDDLEGAGEVTNNKKKGGNKNDSKSKSGMKKSATAKKNVSFNEKDEVFNEYNHVMKKLDLHLRCDKKSCLIDCYRRLYKRDWEVDEEVEDEVSEESSSSGTEEMTESTPKSTVPKKSDYLYNDIYNPNYTKYYSGSDFDFGNRYFTGKERLKKALHLEPVEVTVQKIIYQPMKYRKSNNNRHQQKKKNGGGKRKQK